MNHVGVRSSSGNTAEGVVEEVREPDDLDPVRRCGEQAIQRSRGALGVGQDDQVGALLVDDPGQLGDGTEAGGVLGLVVDGSDDGERGVALDLDALRRSRRRRDVGPTTRTRLFATTRWATDSQIVVSVKTDSGEREDRPARHSEARNPERDRRGPDEARSRSRPRSGSARRA